MVSIYHFNYIKAVTKLPVNITTEELAPIYKLALTSSELTGKLRSTFIVLNDDMLPKRSRSGASGQGQGDVSESGSGSGQNPKRGATSPASGTSEKQKK